MVHRSRCCGRGTIRFRSLMAVVFIGSLLPLTAQSPTPPLRDVFRRVRPAAVVIATRQKELAPAGRRGFVDLQGLGSGVVISEADSC